MCLEHYRANDPIVEIRHKSNKLERQKSELGKIGIPVFIRIKPVCLAISQKWKRQLWVYVSHLGWEKNSRIAGRFFVYLLVFLSFLFLHGKHDIKKNSSFSIYIFSRGSSSFYSDAK